MDIVLPHRGRISSQRDFVPAPKGGDLPSYWASEEKNAKAEIDFLCSHRCNIIPTEVKSGINTQAKSLKTYCQRFQPKKAVRTSLNPHTRSSIEFKTPLYSHTSCELLNIPLYALSRL